MIAIIEGLIVSGVVGGAVFYVVRHYALGKGQICTTSSSGCAKCATDSNDASPAAAVEPLSGYRTVPLIELGRKR